MKNNKNVKVMCGLLVLVLLTTCVIGTTLARYTTSDSASDSARVAKWGVKFNISGADLFDNEYNVTESANVGAVSVHASTNLVAPGTSSANQADGSGSTIFTITGTPEVAVKIETVMDGITEVFLAKGIYKDETTATEDDTFELDKDYYPVVFTLRQISDANGDLGTAVVIGTGKLDDIRAALAEYTGAEYKPNTDLGARFELSWEWAINGNDKADTVLGNLAAGNSENDTLVAGTNYSVNTAYTITLTATQID